MKRSLVLLSLCLLGVLPLRAAELEEGFTAASDKAAAFKKERQEKAEAAKESPKLRKSCPCDERGFTALTDKAKAVAAYWGQKRRVNVHRNLAGLMVFGALIDQRVWFKIQDEQNSIAHEEGELDNLRAKAVSLGGLVKDGEDYDCVLKKGEDYALK